MVGFGLGFDTCEPIRIASFDKAATGTSPVRRTLKQSPGFLRQLLFAIPQERRPFMARDVESANPPGHWRNCSFGGGGLWLCQSVTLPYHLITPAAQKTFWTPEPRSNGLCGDYPTNKKTRHRLGPQYNEHIARLRPHVPIAGCRHHLLIQCAVQTLSDNDGLNEAQEIGLRKPDYCESRLSLRLGIR